MDLVRDIAKVVLGSLALASAHTAQALEQVYILDTPDYSWHTGCFGTASGNLMAYWDRNGFPNFYTGPTGGGLAPLDSNGSNSGIRSLWATRAGFDGRPADQPGHIDDYWEFYLDDSAYSYESPNPDPYILAGRTEHAPDCLGDFIGASQNKWIDFDGECSGNIDAFSFNFWDKQGQRRHNFIPPNQNGAEVRDVQSGWQKWAKSRGSQADVFSQLVEFNPEVPVGSGFTFEDLKAEIDAGYPVLLFLQNPGEFNRTVQGMPHVNPSVHGMVAYGYTITDQGMRFARYRTSWASGNNRFRVWGAGFWEANLALRGVVAFHPLPKITSVTPESEGLRIRWDGPSSNVQTATAGVVPAHWYVIEKSNSLNPAAFVPVTNPATERETVVPNTANTFYRVKLMNAQQAAALAN